MLVMAVAIARITRRDTRSGFEGSKLPFDLETEKTEILTNERIPCSI